LATVTAAATAERALRADARRNLDAILEAAAAAFAEKGSDACVADIAQRAGVGQATIFRRFKTKADLITAVVDRKLARLEEEAEAASTHKRAWDGLREFMQTATELHMRDRGLFEAAQDQVIGDEHLMARKARLLDIVGELVARAKREGDLRKDIVAEDIPVLVCGAAQSGVMLRDAGDEAWRRYLQISLDGLRADGGRCRLHAR
jgi:AcrR family transcriptional regulator